MIENSTSPLAFIRSLIRNRDLIRALIVRDIESRYRGSLLGIFWSFANPVLMLLVYTFMFGVVFQSRWSSSATSKSEFALILFAGLIVFGLFSEMATRSSDLITSNVNYVKKVVFPLELMPLVAFGTALFHFGISLLVWLGFFVIFFGVPPITALLLPLVLLPLALATLGLSWTLSSLGVYMRDVGQIAVVLTSALMFLSPIFYPVSAVPKNFRPVLLANPLTASVEGARDVLIWGRIPPVDSFVFQMLISVAIAWLGYVWFQKTRRGFADVL